MTLKELIEKKKRAADALRAAIAPKLAERKKHSDAISAVRTLCDSEDRDPNETEAEKVRTARAAVVALDAETAPQRAAIEAADREVTDLEAELRGDEEADRLASTSEPTGTRAPAHREATRVGAEERTYRPDNDRNGVMFLQDVAAQFLHGGAATEANERLTRHMVEERAERGDQIDRAVGTSAFAGLVVPQYLTELYAPKARAGRPFADACRHHDLPETGMTVYIGKVTTGTTTALQAAELDTVNETDIDDTLVSVPVQTAAGSQTISRQGLERGVGVENVTMEDLFGAYASTVDNTLLNQATTGLAAVATSIAYTDASPTAAELYPKLVAAPAAVEAALLNQSKGDNIAVMNSRRWYWLQSQLTSTWPMFGTQGIPAQNGGFDYGKVYGSGFRGVLPSGTAVVVDNNVATNLGVGTNEDEIYFGAQSEFHLWEDPNAPMLLRAEQSQVKKLAVDFVAYGYIAYYFTRYAHAQKVAGTGLVTPTF